MAGRRMSVTIDKQGRERITAVVYLAEGQECRSVQLSPKGTVEDLIEHMLKARGDWDELGSDGKITVNAPSADSSTDALGDHYGIVEVKQPPGGMVLSPKPRHSDPCSQCQVSPLTSKGAGGIATERFLPRKLRMDSREMDAVRREWEAITFKQVQAMFSKRMGKKEAPQAKQRAKSKRKQRKQGEEYWFINPLASAKGAEGSVRVKLVNTDDYVVVRKKEGWLKVKERGKKKTYWVVFHENTLLFYKDADDEAPVSTYADVDKFEFNLKSGKKEKVDILLQRGKEKIELKCDNDIMADRWYDAIRQGASGDKSVAAAPRGKRVLKLRMEVAEEIPEYTEEEELADLKANMNQAITANDLAHLALAKGLAAAEEGDQGTYISVDDMKKLHDEEETAYLTVDHMNNILVNTSGDYLTVDAMQELAEEAGYLSLGEAQQLVNTKGDYLTVEDMQELAQEAGYITVAEMRQLAGRE